MDEIDVAPHVPKKWILVFCRTTKTPWVRWLAWGTYKHVRAYAYLPAIKVWLFYDVTLAGTSVTAAPDGPAAEAYIGEFIRDADLVSVEARPRRGLRLAPFSCVSAIKHLVGSRSGALRPDAFFRDCQREGGVPLG